jgi:hypothetical protein
VGRPPGYQWQPLGLDSDPVPGDPGRISEEASHLASVAKQISSQVTELNKIAGGGADGALKGAYADKIHSSAADLAGQLGKVVGRYQKVSTALTNWIPELEQAQKMSLQALNDAEGPYQKLNQTVALPSGDNLTAQQKQDVKNYHSAMKTAQDQLNAAKTLLGKATTLRDNQASHYAGVIHSASDDSMKDSWWDSFKEWVSQHAWIIKDICTVLEVVATVLAIVALFIPGVNIVAALLWIGFGLTAAALLGRVMLAATGNGSWLDVALDAFALMTFGLGKLAAGGLKGAAEGTEALSKTVVAGERSAMLSRGEAFLYRSASVLSDDAKAAALAKWAGKVPDAVPELAKFEGKLPVLTRVALKLGGTSEDAENVRTLLGAVQRWAGNTSFLNNLTAGENFTRILGLNAGTSFVAGVGAPVLGGVEIDGPSGDPVHIGPVPLSLHLPDNPISRTFDKMEDGTTFDDGFSTTQVDDFLRVAGSISIPPIPAFSLASGSW